MCFQDSEFGIWWYATGIGIPALHIAIIIVDQILNRRARKTKGTSEDEVEMSERPQEEQQQTGILLSKTFIDPQKGNV